MHASPTITLIIQPVLSANRTVRYAQMILPALTVSLRFTCKTKLATPAIRLVPNALTPKPVPAAFQDSTFEMCSACTVATTVRCAKIIMDVCHA